MEMPSEETMLIRYSCKDMGLNCSFFVKGETLEEVTEKALEHVREKHAGDFNLMETPAEIERMRQSLMRSTRVVAG
jgi:predicted small metal-binding protein